MSDPAALPAPVIGLTTYLEHALSSGYDTEAAFLPAAYLTAVLEAGGIPVLLPPQPVRPDAVARVLDGIDGLLVTGGYDVDPARYGATAHPRTDVPRPDRDEWEAALMEAALERGMPLLGVCRGMQLLNVVRGGTLEQHLPDALGVERYSSSAGGFVDAAAAARPGTLVADLLDGDDEVAVRSSHHQAVDRVGDGLVVSARSADGTVQAVEGTGTGFVLGVQWHPEEGAIRDLRVVEGLIAAARERRAGPPAA